MQNIAPKLKVGDKVKVEFQSGNKLVGTVLEPYPSGRPRASFGRGENKFESSIQWTSWNGVSCSWKESIYVD